MDFRNRVKGGDLAQLLLEKIPATDSRTIFLVAGAAPELAALQSTGRVRCLDTLSQREMKYFYQALTMFFNPTRLESFGLTNLEALFSGTPVLSTSRGAVPEVVEHLQTGYLADPENPDDFLHGMDYIRRNRLRLSENARLSALKKFSAEQMAAHHIALYREMMNPRKNSC